MSKHEWQSFEHSTHVTRHGTMQVYHAINVGSIVMHRLSFGVQGYRLDYMFFSIWGWNVLHVLQCISTCIPALLYKFALSY